MSVSSNSPSLDPVRLRGDFPVLDQVVNGQPLVYLDNAATTQKPRVVIEAIWHFYSRDNANVHRGIHALSERATLAYENARRRAAEFLDAGSPREIIFTRGTTEGLNLLANSLGALLLRPGRAILLTEMEHHSNLVPWQILAEKTGARLLFVPVDPDSGRLDVEAARQLLAQEVAIFSFTHISNTLGTVNPARELCAMAEEAGAVSIVDAAQSAGHRPISVRELGCDFLVCSGHKMCGPMGIGLLYGRSEILEKMPPWQGGGEMISRVTYEGSTWKEIPHKFEAGTPNVEGAIGLHAALDYLETTAGRVAIREHDLKLARRTIEALQQWKDVRIFGSTDPRDEHAGAVSFSFPGVHAHDLVTLANEDGVALRGGHHCNQPLMKKLGVPATARASFYFYNTEEEVGRLIDSLARIRGMFQLP
jgi:cysteine desulfurase/selenocysteine lyase